MLDEYLKQAFLMVAVVSGIPLAISSLAGLLVAVLQTATQIQEQSISFLVKVGVISLVLIFGFGWVSTQLVAFMQRLFWSFPLLGNMP
mgnify:CR=1 FL=1